MNYLGSDDDSSSDDNNCLINIKENPNLLSSTMEEDTLADFEATPVFQQNNNPRPASKYEVSNASTEPHGLLLKRML